LNNPTRSINQSANLFDCDAITIMTGMTDNIISIAEWLAKRRKVPVYEVVADPNGGVRLELVERVEWEEALPPGTRVHLYPGSE